MTSLFLSVFQFSFQVANVVILTWQIRLTGNAWYYFGSFHSQSQFISKLRFKVSKLVVEIPFWESQIAAMPSSNPDSFTAATQTGSGL